MRVDGLRKDFLAYAAFAKHQYGGVRQGGLRRVTLNLRDGGAVADNTRKREARAVRSIYLPFV